MAEYNFATLPSVSIPRTKSNQPFFHNLSCNLGEIVVVQCKEVLPGSTHKLQYGTLIRMSTPTAPIMDDLQVDLMSFFVPSRLTWTNWKRFMGENTSGAGAINGVNSDKTIPSVNVDGSLINTVADDMGIPPYVANRNDKIGILQFRAFGLIYDRWFRNQNVEAPAIQNLGDTPSWTIDLFNMGLVQSGTTPGTNISRWKAYKLPDMFTTSLPYAQKGDPVQIPLTGLAPVGVIPTSTSGGSPTVTVNSPTSWTAGQFTPFSSSGPIGNHTMYADLDAAINSTINDLRFAYAMQRFLEKDSAYGSRYWELLYAHFAVTSPDATLQDPQLLGHIKFDLVINQVLQTTGFVDPTNTNLGTPGANSTTAKSGDICTASFCEHGFLITLKVTRQKHHTYSQGYDKQFLRQNRIDFYFPCFANLGAQKVLVKELYANAVTGNNTFGFQEAWCEYRFSRNYNSGLLNPVRTGSLDYWTLAENFGSAPTLSTSFLKEDRTALSRALVTGSAGPDFIESWFIMDTVVNPMPLYSIPGFSDHN